jgi:deoxycytidylate deaminase
LRGAREIAPFFFDWFLTSILLVQDELMPENLDQRDSLQVEVSVPALPVAAKRSAESFRQEDAELVFGVVYAAGTHVEPVVDALKDYIRRFGYTPQEVRISDYIKKRLKIDVSDKSEADRIESLIRGGNQICRDTKRKDFLALAAVAEIAEQREVEGDGTPKPRPRTAYIIRSLKRPEEAATLRQIYHPGFYQISVFASEDERLRYLVERKGVETGRAETIIEKDQREQDDEYGQRTRDTFHRADVFVEGPNELKRFLDLIFGEPFTTPNRDEYAMFMAASASLRSAQYGRQVGAAIANELGEILALGCNEVPQAGGGLYWPEDSGSCRDHERDSPTDSNDEAKFDIEQEVISKFSSAVDSAVRRAVEQIGEGLLANRLREIFVEELKLKPGTLRNTKIFEITEYGRAVHAEMNALLNCASASVSPKGGTLFTTAFPCHNCTRHIIAAGIARVVYIEPYPKSRAVNLHGDAIHLGKNEDRRNLEGSRSESKIPFVPFVGVGPRRFFDLFSMDLMSSGYPLERKSEGVKANWSAARNRGPRTPMLPASYLDRELGAVREEHESVQQSGDGGNARSQETRRQPK